MTGYFQEDATKYNQVCTSSDIKKYQNSYREILQLLYD